ncbi:hypothetical protein BZL39_E05460 [Zygosaccharomyces parabailii]|uniref:BN860_04192g1_1 n=1 Tax=Zygosaccharomyces bailii (strain CLIB 213 / ATCC 58445 / CBS 680 / BCRC 21525 / NBRC 1098 / NCYC 1416 / NRRL Y-2227) TaxID=1333698 RepID=A0A8J2T4A5_ZYGB2|nr:hypothetical protein BZL39_E05460 [Zygosaccharomyces parabailii]CDF88183.1 BN860_04192g1_1 [Zygosaccharomyces bailii CLIB 213]CDH14919.1 related to NADPH-dependent 1-acyldihydroxyacetone phosphate reductase [Zygosaccharomyces bailii ISA1307]
MSMPDNRKKTALVTGASSGIGFEIARELARNGYKVFACARRVDPMEALVQEFSEDLIVLVRLDISQPSEITKLSQQLESQLENGKLDVLYNNAGQPCTAAAVDVTNDAMEQCFKVNVFGHVNMCREFSKYVVNAKGTIVFTGSVAGELLFPFGSIYCATKAAIHQYARVLHFELKPFGVRVINAVTGTVDTPIGIAVTLPSDSIFNTKGSAQCFEAFLEKQTEMVHDGMPANVYAQKLVADIQSDRDPVDVYRGKMATTGSILALIVPYGLLEYAIRKILNLDKLFALLKKNNEEIKSD